jgi:hypothetical protein
MTDITPLIQEIQSVVAPAVMVSSAALLLLGFQAKHSNLANRFRALNHEKRLLASKATRDQHETGRLQSLQQQVDHLMRRATYVQRAIVCAYSAIGCFTGSSVLIFVSAHVPAWLGCGVIAIFMSGLACLMSSVVLMIRETQLFHKILTLERHS